MWWQLHDAKLDLEKSKRRAIVLPEARPAVISKINPKKNPDLLAPTEQSGSREIGKIQEMLQHCGNS